MAPYWLMPTPWPKPAPRIVKVVLAPAGAASNSVARMTEKSRVIGSVRKRPSKLAGHPGRGGVAEVELAQGVGPVRGVPGGGGRQVRLRHPGRGDFGPERIPAGLVRVLRAGAPRAGRGVHGRHVRPPH